MICSAEDLFTLNSNKFRMVYNVDGNPHLDLRDWNMYSNILRPANLIENWWFSYDVIKNIFMQIMIKSVGPYNMSLYQT